MKEVEGLKSKILSSGQSICALSEPIDRFPQNSDFFVFFLGMFYESKYTQTYRLKKLNLTKTLKCYYSYGSKYLVLISQSVELV